VAVCVCQAFHWNFGFVLTQPALWLFVYTSSATVKVFWLFSKSFVASSLGFHSILSGLDHIAGTSLSVLFSWNARLMSWGFSRCFHWVIVFLYLMFLSLKIHSSASCHWNWNQMHRVVNGKRALYWFASSKESFICLPLVALESSTVCHCFDWLKTLISFVDSIHRKEWYSLACSLHLGNCERTYDRTWNRNLIKD